MLQIPNSVKLVLVGLTFVVAAFYLSVQVSAQGIEAYLRKADLDGNGKIEPSEMTPPIRQFIASKGHDIEKRHSITEFVKQLNQSKAKQQEVAAKGDLRVPKFGVDSKAKVSISTFGDSTATEQYSEDVTKKARELLAQYDRNGNGILDKFEISRMRWGSPRPSANDKNGDGQLTFDEIQGRYRDREVAEQRAAQSSRDGGKDGGNTKEQESGERRGRGRYGRGGSPNRDSGNSSSGRVVISSPSPSEQVSGLGRTSGRTRDYVDKYFSDRDEDGNGVLEGDELKKVSRVSKYDKNGDGKIKAEEMLAVLTPKEATTSSSKKSSTSGRRTGTSSRTQSKNKLDANGDGVIQMHEFSKEWTQKKLDEFLAKDKNGDGVLSPEQGER